MQGTLQLQLGRIRHRIWIVAFMVAIFLLGGVISVLTTKTAYTSTAALDATSLTRSPDQDATLASGYVNFFNDPNYQATLRTRAKVPGDVTFEAQTAAASPLIYIVASSPDREAVRPAASKMATALLDTVNDARRASRDDTIAAVRQPYDDARAANGVIPQEALIQLESAINQLNANTTNQLSVLELDSGVSSAAPKVAQTIGLALVAGVVVGGAVALAMGALTRRVDSAFDLTERTGLRVLAELPRREKHRQAQRYGQLANALSRSPGARVLAFAAVSGPTASAPAAWAVAAHRADQGATVVVLDADLTTAGSGPGLAEYLSSTGAVDVADIVGPSDRHAGVLEVRRGADVEGVPAMAQKRFDDLLVALQERVEVVVVIAPPVVETADAQVVCASAGVTVLVVERAVTKVADVAEAKRLLAQVDAIPVGALLIEKGTRATKGVESAPSVRPAVVPAQGSAEPAETASMHQARTNGIEGVNGTEVSNGVKVSNVVRISNGFKRSTGSKGSHGSNGSSGSDGEPGFHGTESVRTSHHRGSQVNGSSENDLPAWDLSAEPSTKV